MKRFIFCILFLAFAVPHGAVAEDGSKSDETSRAQAKSTGNVEDLIDSITPSIVWEGRKSGQAWSQTRACLVPTSDGPAALMTLQKITGSDYYGPVLWTWTRDGGQHWSEPQEIPGLGWQSTGESSQQGVCDVVPEYHAKTNTVLAIGHTVHYQDGKLAEPQPPRWPMYVVRDANGEWSPPKRLEWNDPRTTQIYTCSCAQRINLPNGDVLIPMSFAPKSQRRSVTTVICSFDGNVLQVQKVGNELKTSAGRGLLEPSLAQFGGKYYMTIRAEDKRGYVTVSDDGLDWKPQQAWAWDDGEAIEMSTTQQRWLPHSEGLYLVYTRKDAQNSNVFRWRAPLYVARFDPATLHLIRSTEQIVLPLNGDGLRDPKNVAQLGNFHTVAISPTESWVTVGELLSTNFTGDLLLARINWKHPNKLISTK